MRMHLTGFGAIFLSVLVMHAASARKGYPDRRRERKPPLLATMSSRSR